MPKDKKPYEPVHGDPAEDFDSFEDLLKFCANGGAQDDPDIAPLDSAQQEMERQAKIQAHRAKTRGRRGKRPPRTTYELHLSTGARFSPRSLHE